MSWNLFGVNRPSARCELLIFGSCIYKTQGSKALSVEFGAYLAYFGGGGKILSPFQQGEVTGHQTEDDSQPGYLFI